VDALGVEDVLVPGVLEDAHLAADRLERPGPVLLGSQQQTDQVVLLRHFALLQSDFLADLTC
jgi:hypothetical protein